MDIKRISINCLSDTQGNTNITVMDMMKTFQNLKIEFDKEIEILKKPQAEVKM